MKYLLLLILIANLSLVKAIVEIKTSKILYNGYISENIHQAADDTNVYIRFIDFDKPKILLTNLTNCKYLSTKIAFKIQNGNDDDYFDEPVVDATTGSVDDFMCFIQLKLKSNRDQLNREAKDQYSLNISIESSDLEFELLNRNFLVKIQILDDNDNDPLFDKYEYLFDLNDLSYLPALAIIGSIKAYDADLARNAEISYFINKFNPIFGCIRSTGEIFIKYDTRYLFNNYEQIKGYFSFEAKSIDSGPKLDFYDYLVENQTSRAFKLQNSDSTFINVRLNSAGLNEIKTNIQVKHVDGLVVLKMIQNQLDYFDLNFNLLLNQANGENFIRIYLDKKFNNFNKYERNYSLIYEIVNDDFIDFDKNITYSIDICLKSNSICVKKFIYSQNFKQLFNDLCKFKVDVKSRFDVVSVGSDGYRLWVVDGKVGDVLMKIGYDLDEAYNRPYYLSMNLCKYAQMKIGTFRFNYTALSFVDFVNVGTDSGVVVIKNATTGFNFTMLIRNLNNVVDDYQVTIQVGFIRQTGRSVSLASKNFNKSIRLFALNGVLKTNEIVYEIQENYCQLESDSSLFKIKSTSLLTSYDYKFQLNDILANKTNKFLVKIQCSDELTNLNVEIVPIGIPYNLPMPYLDNYIHNLNDPISKIKFHILPQANELIDVSNIYKITSKFLTINNLEYDQLPFKYDLSTQQLYYLNKTNVTEYQFKILFTFNFSSIEYNLATQVNFKLKQADTMRLSDLKCDTSTIQTINFLNIPKWSAYLPIYGKSQPIGFVRLKLNQQIDQQLSYELINSSLYINPNQSIFEINEQNGALYVNDDILLILRRQYQQQRLNINLFVRVSTFNDSKLCKVRVRVQPTSTQQTSNHQLVDGGQTFYTNTNNLINFFLKGNELVVNSLRITENARENAVILNLKEYFRQNCDKKKMYYFESVLNSINFTLLDDRYFHIESLTSNLVTNYQLDYEHKQSYNIQIKMDQYLNNYEIDDIANQVYTYYLDMKINIGNQVDELLTTKWPIYYLTFDLVQLSETEDDEIFLFQIPIIDYEQNHQPDHAVSYKCSILNKNLKNIFYVSKNLSVNIDRRKLAFIKSNSEYELDLKLSDNYERVNRFKLLITFLEPQIEAEIIDIDETGDDEIELNPATKPIVNDINLSLYDYISDTSKPLTQIIVFNLDMKSTYTFQLTRVQVQFLNKKHQQNYNRTFLNKLFYIDQANGYVYVKQSQLPCSNCTFSLTYRINKTTPIIKNGKQSTHLQQHEQNSDYYDYSTENGDDEADNFKVTTRRGLIKLQVFKLDDSLVKIMPIKTFSLPLNETIYLNRNLKLGEKITEVRIQRDAASDTLKLPTQAMTNYFLLNNEDLTKQIFYLSNHDGSLYLIKKLNFNLRQTIMFNLTIQITNFLGQYELFSLNVCLNNKRPQFDLDQQQKFEINIDLDDLNREYETKLLRLKQAVDADLEENSYKIENCYYFSHSIQIPKNLTGQGVKYPLCNSNEYIEMDKKTASLELRFDMLVKFLLKSSDLLVNNGDNVKSLVFLIDYSVFNSLSLKSDLTRVEIKINFKELPKQTPKNQVAIESPTLQSEKIMFKKSEYYLKIKKFDVGLQLIDLSSEIQFVNTSLNQTIKPFELNFTISRQIYLLDTTEKPTKLIDIIQNVGILYLNANKEKNQGGFIKLEINCNYLTSTTNTFIYFELEEQFSELEWKLPSINASLIENRPSLSLIEVYEYQPLRLTNYIRGYNKNENYMFYFLEPSTQNLFEIDQFIGTIRSKFKSTLDSSSFNFKVLLCKMNEICSFNKQKSILTINVSIKPLNNSDASKIEIIEAKNQLSTDDLLPGLTVFKLKNEGNVNIQVDGYIDQNLFGITSFNFIKQIYLTNLGYMYFKNLNKTIGMNIFCLTSNQIDLNLRLTINKTTSTERSNTRLIETIKINRLDDDLIIYKFNDLEDVQLLNYEYLFYISKNYLYFNKNRSIGGKNDGQYDLYFHKANSSTKFYLRIEFIQKTKNFFIPKSLVYSTKASHQLNLELFSMKLNITMKLDDLLETNQTQPIIVFPHNSSIVESNYEYLFAEAQTLDHYFTYNLFRLDPTNGYLYVNKTFVNDFKISYLNYLKKFTFQIQLGGYENEKSVGLVINLITLESYKIPYFLKSIYYFEINSTKAIESNDLSIENFSKFVENKNMYNTIYYDLIDGDEENVFYLDFKTGALSLRNNSDMKVNPTYCLILKVFDINYNDQVYYTNLTIFINFTNIYDADKKKLSKIDFTRQEYLLEIDENLPKTTLIYKLNENLDKQNFRYTINYKLENHQDKFYLNETNGYLYTKISFDYETLEQLNPSFIDDTADLIISKELVVKIVASYYYGNQISCFVRIRIGNINDNKPQFANTDINYVAFVPDNNNDNVFITRIYAYDLDLSAKNQNLTYSVVSSRQGLFSMDEINGNLYLNTKKYRFYEPFNQQNENFSLTIIANDTLFSNLLMINVRVLKVASIKHDQFDNNIYNCSINEDALPGTHVVTLNTNNDYKYHIIYGDLYNQFELNSKTGKLYTRLLLDREYIPFYSLDILAVNEQSKIISKLYVYINDINDNRPICNDSLRFINTSSFTNNQLSSFYAYDADTTSRFKYNVVSNDQIPIKIDKITGVMRLTTDYTAKLNEFYEFYVRIADQDNYYCLIKVTLTIDDQSMFKKSTASVQPKFLKTVYTNEVYENVAKYTKIDVLSLNDRSLYGIVQFSLLPNSDLIRINPKYGYLQINTDNFDREIIGDWLNFTIQVGFHNHSTSTAKYYLRVLDLNDNLPQFDEPYEAYMNIEENLAKNTLVYNLHATDPDLNSKTIYKFLTKSNKCCNSLYDLHAEQYDIHTNDYKYFTLNEQTGEIFTKEILDYEQTENLILYFIAIDPEFNYTNANPNDLSKTIFKLNIMLIDLNDNKPYFEKSMQDLYYLHENCELNTTVAFIKAFDLDKTDKIRFSIVGKSNYFAIDEHTGRLYTIGLIDYEQDKELHLKIRVENPGDSKSINDFDIRIEIINLNDNKPIFVGENETIFINENYPLGTQLYKLQIADEDVTNADYANYTFMIIKQYLNVDSLIELTKPIFSINKNLSLILIDKPILNRTYIVQVRVYDNENFLLNSDTWLTIHVAQDVEQKSINLNILLIENQYNLLNNQIIYNLNETTAQINEGIFRLDKNGDLKLVFNDEKILLSSEYKLNIIENVKIHIQFTEFNAECLANVVKLKINHTKPDYLDEFKLMLKLLFNLNSFEQVIILSTSVTDGLSELLFAITRNTNPNQCYNSKLIRKFLLKNADYLHDNYKLRFVSVKYLSNCNSSNDICLTNSNCKVNFYYNTTKMQCFNDTNCMLYPTYKLSCLNLVNYKSKSVASNRCKTANPCKNNAICKQVNTNKKYKIHCFCTHGYTGKYCDVDVDECSLYQPCSLNSTCVNTNGSFLCNCNHTSCYNYTFQQLYSKLSNSNEHQSTSISSSLSSIIADGKNFLHNYDLVSNNSDSENRSFLSMLHSKDTLLGIFSGIFIVLFIFVLVLLISLFVYKIKKVGKHKVPVSSSTSSNRDIHDVDENIDDFDENDGVEEEEEKVPQQSTKGLASFFKRKTKTYSSTSSRKKLVVRNKKNYNTDNRNQSATTASNCVKLKLLNNEINISSVHNTFQREVKLKNLIDQSTTTTKTLEKNLIKDNNNLESSKKIIDYEKSPTPIQKVTAQNDTEKKCDLVVKLNNTNTISTTTTAATITPNIISPDYNYVQLYNTNKKINKKTIRNDEVEGISEVDEVVEIEEAVITRNHKYQQINEQNNLDKDDGTSNIIEDCQGFYWDITDWATTIDSTHIIEQKVNKDSASLLSNELNNNYDKLQLSITDDLFNDVNPIISNTNDVYPIYSQVRKFGKQRLAEKIEDPLLKTVPLKTFISETNLNLNEKISLTNSNEDNNSNNNDDFNIENSFTNTADTDNNNLESNIASNYIYLLNNDLNKIVTKDGNDKNHLNEYLPVYKPVKLLNNILNDSTTTTATTSTTTTSSSVSINHANTPADTNQNEYDYIYNKYNQFRNTNIMQTFKSIQHSNDDKHHK